MENTRKNVFWIIIGLVFTMLLGGCSANKTSEYDQLAITPDMRSYTAADVDDFVTSEIVTDDDLEGSNSVYSEEVNRKIITRIDYELETKNYTDSINTLNSLTDSTGGIIESSSEGGDEQKGTAHARFVLRIPSKNLYSFKNSVQNIGNVVYTSTNTEDVTGEFFDTEARLKVLEAQEKRILELLDRAENIEDIMKIENELSRIRTDIERYTTVVKRLQNLTDYSTISVSLNQTKIYTVTNDSFFTKLTQTIKDSFSEFVSVLGEIGIAIIWFIPYAIIIAIVVIVIVMVRKKKKKMSKALDPPKIDEEIKQ